MSLPSLEQCNRTFRIREDVVEDDSTFPLFSAVALDKQLHKGFAAFDDNGRRLFATTHNLFRAFFPTLKTIRSSLSFLFQAVKWPLGQAGAQQAYLCGHLYTCVLEKEKSFLTKEMAYIAAKKSPLKFKFVEAWIHDFEYEL